MEQVGVHHTSGGVPGLARKSPYECQHSQVHMYTRRHVAFERRALIVEANHQLAIVMPLAYLANLLSIKVILLLLPIT